MNTKIIQGDCLEVMRGMADGSVHCCVTSPPYFGLRDYGVDGQLGLEPTPDEYVAGLVKVFREVRRVLRDDGTLWLNLGDSYGKAKQLQGIPWRVAFALQADGWYLRQDIIWHKPNPMPESVRDRCTKAHEYIFMLSKSKKYYYDHEAVKEPCRARPRQQRAEELAEKAGLTKEHISAIRAAGNTDVGQSRTTQSGTGKNTPQVQMLAEEAKRALGGYYREFLTVNQKRNRRSVWTVTTKPFKGAHFAVFPTALVEPCIKAGTSLEGCCPECGAGWVRVVERPGQIRREATVGASERRDQDRPTGHDLAMRPAPTTTGWRPSCEHAAKPVPCTVLDPFGGSGTTAMVAEQHGRSAILCELNPEYIEIAKKRLA